MSEKLAFLGGSPAIGKSSLGRKAAEESQEIEVHDFSDLMMRHLPSVTDGHDILNLTSAAERRQARVRAVEDLRSPKMPTLLVGHYAVCSFSEGNRLESIELAFPSDLVSIVSGLALAYLEEPTASFLRDKLKPGTDSLSRFEFEAGIEDRVFTFLSDSGITNIRLPLDRGDVVLPRLLTFLRPVLNVDL